MYKIQRNYRDAFNEEAFIDKYIEECFDKYMYIVGDISSGILRLKGFDVDMKSKNPWYPIDNYLEVSCAFGCPYFILKRIKTEDEYNKLLNKPEGEHKEEKPLITPIVKESFDKESLVLETSKKAKPNIIINPAKMNAIPKGELPADLREAIKDGDSNQAKPQREAKPEPQVEITTYVSASSDFDPSKKESFKKPNGNKQNNKPNNKKGNNNNGNNNSNQQRANKKKNKPKNHNKPQADR